MSEVPNEIFENIKESWEQRREILKGSEDGTDYRFKPIDVLKIADDANTEAQAVVNEVLNEAEITMNEFIVGYKVANGICGFARDNLAISSNRIKNIVGYLNEVDTDIEGERLAAAIPGYIANTEEE